ncbi:hypothetical protein TcCL_Unassigned00886 [Trypanosoma cruzi]|nr:hypothetical protein TcCL_Unassigned00886 [Trypanosoma cruzi]
MGHRHHPPAHSLFLLPMAWPSCTSTNAFASQSCVPQTQALKWRFGNTKFNTSEKQRKCSQRPHGTSTHPQALLTTLQCGGKEYRRLSCHRRRPMGAVFTAQKMLRCETEEAVGGPAGDVTCHAWHASSHSCNGDPTTLLPRCLPVRAPHSRANERLNEHPAEGKQLAVQTIPSLVNVPAAAPLARRRSLSSFSPVRHPRIK